MAHPILGTDRHKGGSPNSTLQKPIRRNSKTEDIARHIIPSLDEKKTANGKAPIAQSPYAYPNRQKKDKFVTSDPDFPEQHVIKKKKGELKIGKPENRPNEVKGFTLTMPPPSLSAAVTPAKSSFRAGIEAAKKRLEEAKKTKQPESPIPEIQKEAPPPVPPLPLSEPPKTPRRTVQPPSITVEKDESKTQPTTPRRVSFKEEPKSPELPQSIIEKYKDKGELGQHVLEMMKKTMKGEDYVLPDSFMEGPEILSELEIRPEKKIQRFITDMVNAAALNLLFPEPKDAPPREKPYRLDEFSEVEIEPIYATPEQISSLEISEEEKSKVTTLSFFRSSISDAQLNALIEKFPNVENVQLTLCTKITDTGLSPISGLKGLKSLQVRFCPNTSTQGMVKLPLDELEEFGLSTQEEIQEDLVEKVAKSPRLKKVSFDFSKKVTPKVVRQFKNAQKSSRIELSVRGCPMILEETSEELEKELNEDREDQPISVFAGKPEASDHLEAGVPRAVSPPPEIEEADDILSRETIRKIFPETNPGAIPHESVITEYDFSQTPVRGINLSGDVHSEKINHSLNAIIEKCPDIEIVRIYDSRAMGYSGIVPLRQLYKTRILYLGKLPGITAKMIENMLSDNKGNKTWLELEEIHLGGMPVSDDALNALSHLPKLKKVNVSGCRDFTVQGLYHLARRAPKLEVLSIVDCPSIDRYAVEDFENLRPDVELISDKFVDSTAVQLAVTEADQRMFTEVERHYVFLQELLDENAPIPIGRKIDADPERVTAYYMSQFRMLNLEVAFNQFEDPEKQWLRFDLILQSYMNISRVAWAYLKELKRVGFFTNVEAGKPPETVLEITRLLKFRNDKGECPYVKKVKMFDLSDLGATFIPNFILDENEWPQMTNIKLQGNSIEYLPQKFKERCHRVETVEYSNHKIEALQAFTDESIEKIPDLAELQELTISYSDHFTVRGIAMLLSQCKSLTLLGIERCRSIDALAIDEFTLKRPPEIKLKINIQVNDPSASELAVAEADLRMSDPNIPKEFHYHRDFTHVDSTLPANVKLDFEALGATNSYIAQLSRLGIPVEMDSKENPRFQWLRWDLILQSYHNICRSAREIEKELFLRNAFATSDAEKWQENEDLRTSVRGLIELLKGEDENGEPYVDKLPALNFSDLGITFIPSFILDLTWKNVKRIDLRNTHITQLPDASRKSFPSLVTVHAPAKEEPAPPPGEEKSAEKSTKSAGFSWSNLWNRRKNKG